MSLSATPYKNQRYAELKQACRNSSKLFEDPEFPAANPSLFYQKSPSGSVEWKRPGEICDDPHLFIEGISCRDLNQGMLGNCWFVAVCSCLALRPELWKKVIPDWKEQDWDSSHPENYAGIFHFRFWVFGEWLDVVVDDRLPTIDGKLIYCHSRSQNEFWSALLEKAYAKLSSCYESLEGGRIGDTLVDFTGAVADHVDLAAGNYVTDVSARAELFQSLSKVFDGGGIICCSIKAHPAETGTRMDCGLVKGHAYSVTSVRKMRLGQVKIFMIRMWNPWGETEWNGLWSSSSEEWLKVPISDRVAIGLSVEDNGEFWMAFEDWCKYITNADICHLNKTSSASVEKTCKQAVHFGSWTKHPAPLLNRCGGSESYQETFLENPQYMLNLVKEATEVLVSLQQRDMRLHESVAHGENLTIGFVILKVELNRKYRMHARKTQKIVAASEYANARTVFLRRVLPRGCYVIIPTTLTADVLGDFMIRVFTDADCGFRELMEDKPRVKCWSAFLGYPQVVTYIHIEQAEGLENQDSTGGTDPYLIIHCEGRTIQSSIFKDTLEPIFDTMAIFYRRKPSKPIIIEIWNSNDMQDEFMGQVVLPATTDDSDDQLKLQLCKKGQNSKGKMPGTLSLRVISSTQLTRM